jgi:diguanylate cyclase (GGDEF)-like protein
MLSAEPHAMPSRHTETERPQDLLPVLAALLPALLEHQGDPLCIKDAVSGRWVHASAAMGRLLQRPPASLVGLTDADVFDSGLATQLRAADLAAQGSADPVVSDHRFEWAGLRREFAVMRLVVEAGERALLCCVWQDQGAARLQEAQLRSALEQLEIEQRANQALRREIREQGLRDGQPGPFTRANFEDQLRREIDLSMREQREFALVLVDIDPWADAVREGGEAAQMRIVDALGRLLRSNTRAMDASCHLDGGRYAVLLSGVGLATAHGRMEQLRRQCSTQIVMHESRQLRFTVSIGVASFPHTAHTRDQLTLACEQAVAQARKKGNHVSLASIRLDPG